MTADRKLARLEKRYAQARRMERLTATRLRRLVTALQGWQDEREKCERLLHADTIDRLIAEEKVKHVVKRLTGKSSKKGE